ncbi:MAG: serine/threonine-protein kinase, partial [Planctomycetota bacterium]|nr:serine/threonine-protein kinase [Planctomycetota bacterium]
MLDAEREERLAKLFRMALNVAPEALDTFIESHCGDDAELREELSGLLEEDAGGTAGILGQNLFRAQREVGGRVGPYRLLEVLGEGGMGTVHLAEQTEPVQRKVALKTIRLGMASDEVLARFDAERQALARMNHPGIAEIYDAGTTESGLPWFAMEYCPGSTLVAHCDNGRLSVDERLALLIGVCEAVQHAHQKGVIHRDLKPSNVLVTQRDHRPVPKVIDFGVARAVAGGLTPEAWHTSAGDTVGTWLYMSPEQADPKGDVDTRADVWALGAMLHELLCGAPPFQADNVARIAAALLREEPKPPSRRLAELQAHAAEAVAKARRLDRNGLAR